MATKQANNNNNTQDTLVLSQVDWHSPTESAKPVETGPVVWGRLYPIGSAFQKVDLRLDSLTCGRRDSCDICLENVRTAYCSDSSYSNVHFTITKVSNWQLSSCPSGAAGSNTRA